MKRRILRDVIVLLSVIAMGAAILTGCRSSAGDELRFRTLSLSISPEDWLPIVNEKPRDPADARELANCAEKSFDPPVRGPWETTQGRELAAPAEISHKASDKIVRVGGAVAVEATMSYGDEPLIGEWVRLFIGTCDGWRQVGDRKTNGAGRVAFRLQERMPAGIYGVAFQVVGDGSVVRSQLWVVPRETKVVAFQIQGAAIEEATSTTEEKESVPGAVSLAGWHASNGELVSYVDLDPHSGQVVEEWRQSLRKQGFPVGPVLRRSEAEPADIHDGDNGWGEAGDMPSTAPMANLRVSKFYAESLMAAHHLRDVGARVEEIADRSRYCRPGDGDEERTGWSTLADELIDDVETPDGDLDPIDEEDLPQVLEE